MEPKLDVLSLLETLEDYVIIRKSNMFPDYNLFDDLDIVCKDSEKNASSITKYGKIYTDNGFNIRQTYQKNHLHLDFHYGTNPINFRFDFIDTIDHSPSVKVDNSFLDMVLENKQKLYHQGLPYYVPSEEHEMMFRLLEYFDYPEKYRHLKYVRDRIQQYPEVLTSLKKYTDLDILRTHNLLRA